MPRSRSQEQQQQSEPATSLGADLPSWVTPELIDKTLKVWQPYYSARLTYEDAIAIIKNVGVLVDCLTRETEK